MENYRKTLRARVPRSDLDSDFFCHLRALLKDVQLYIAHHEDYKRWACMEMWDRDQVLSFLREKYGRTNRLLPAELPGDLLKELARRHLEFELDPIIIYQHPPAPGK